MAYKNERWMCFIGVLCVAAGFAFSQETVRPEETMPELTAPETVEGPDIPAEEPPPEKEVPGGENIIEQTGQGFRISQRLNWLGDEFASRYEVIIEAQGEGGRYREVLRQPTEDTFIEVSLSPGKYRYKVLVYNILGRVDHEMDWSVLDVIRALPPALTKLNPETFLIDKKEQGEIVLSGQNLIEESEVFLVPIDDGKGSAGVVKPLAWLPDPSGNRARIVLDKKNLPPGRYKVHVRNPGNLEVSLDTLKVAYYRLLDINLMAGYVPMAPLYGYVFSLTEEKVFSGALVRLSMNPMARKNIAFELEPFFYTARPFHLSREAEALGGIGSPFFFIGSPFFFTGIKAYGLYRAPFAGDRMVFNLRFGGGILLMNISNYADMGNSNYKYGDGISLIPVISGGISFQFMITKSLFIEAGASFTHGIITEKDSEKNGGNEDIELMPGYIDPVLGIGWRF
ncbi:MAG: hypothetical protein LBP23_09425 [Treponema sp.]|jgi:hypothetical protein|nr:hypothetical protein [Treponema sp.]